MAIQDGSESFTPILTFPHRGGRDCNPHPLPLGEETICISLSEKGSKGIEPSSNDHTSQPSRYMQGALGFIRDVLSVAIRALRGIPRDPEAIYPALIIPVFFYAINIGALQDVAERIPGVDYKAFQLPVGIIFAVTGVSRAVTMVTDIQSGYFDRLSLTPINRLAMLLGFTVADLVLVVVLTLPVVVLGLAVGVRFESGLLGMLLFMLLSGLWGLAYTGFPMPSHSRLATRLPSIRASCCSSRSCS